MILDLIILVIFIFSGTGFTFHGLNGPWLVDLNVAWIPWFGIRFHLAADGLSLVLILLTHFLGIVSVACSWTEITERTGFFHFNLMWVLAGIIGVFTALDLFLFYFFWELMMVPMFLLIAIWGHENRIYAAIKFFLFTQSAVYSCWLPLWDFILSMAEAPASILSITWHCSEPPYRLTRPCG